MITIFSRSVRTPLALIGGLLVAALATGLPASAVAASSDPRTATAAAAPKKSKPKKKEPLTATVNGTFTLRYDVPFGFGNDSGPNWQQLKLVIKDAKIPFKGKNRQSAAAKVDVRWEYEAEAHTQDRSWALGCDSEDRSTYGGWSGEALVSVSETTWRQTNGESKKYAGWRVTAEQPDDGIYVVSRGSYLAWESILMQNCLTYEANTPLGGWSTGFGQPDGLGKLNSDGRGMLLNASNTGKDQTATADGKVKFNQSVKR